MRGDIHQHSNALTHVLLDGVFRYAKALSDLPLGKPFHAPQQEHVARPSRHGGDNHRQSAQFVPVSCLYFGRRICRDSAQLVQVGDRVEGDHL